jgi:crotonobetainyl-CoA:carnitine CoA-transferase CaiB-like acyl-CoA transferase
VNSGLGENNAAILSELGYDGAAIEALQRDKVI